MPNTFLKIATLLLLVFVSTPTTITFYVDHEVEQPLDYV